MVSCNSLSIYNIKFSTVFNIYLNYKLACLVNLSVGVGIATLVDTKTKLVPGYLEAQ